MSTYELKHPVVFGSEEITTLELKPSAGAFKGFKQELGAEGGVVFDPYSAMLVALRMAGKPTALADKIHPEDMMGLAQVALGFFTGGLPSGSAPSR